MNKDELISLLENSPHQSNLNAVIEGAIELIELELTEIKISYDKNQLLPASHFYKIYSGRLRNPNGVALRTPGVVQSVQNFSQTDEDLEGILVEGKRFHIAIWLDRSGKIIGCIKSIID